MSLMKVTPCMHTLEYSAQRWVNFLIQLYIIPPVARHALDSGNLIK